MNLKSLCVLGTLFAAWIAAAFEYNVRQPSEVLRPTWYATDTRPGVWTLNVEDAKAKARTAGVCTVVLNTASWWCPYCETLEDMVLRSQAWKDFVQENGFYLGMYDFPYRNDVPVDQAWKSWHPELGRGWGFKCWLMSPDYLGEIGLTEEEGLQAIMAEYEQQKAIALSGASVQVISNWNGTAEFEYGKVGYPTILVYGPDGKELGRTGFPWYSTADVTASEAQEFVIQSIAQLVNGKCTVCEDPRDGAPDASKAQVYTGWLNAGDGIVGLIEVKTARQNGKGLVRVSGSVTLNGRKISLASAYVRGPDASGDDASDVTFGEFRLEKQNTPYAADLSLGANGLTGVFTDGETAYAIDGGRDVFKLHDADSVARAAQSPKGVWSILLKSAEAEAPSPFARGYGTLAADMRAKGVVKIAGTLADGTKVKVTARAIAGDNGLTCVPFQAPLYGKKGGLGFVMWFKNGRLLCFSDISPWVAAGKDAAFTMRYTPSSTMSAGPGTIPEELELSIADFPEETTFGGYPLAWSPDEDEVTVVRNKWKGSDVTRFTASMNRSGELKGTLTFFVDRGRGNPRQVRGAFTGVVMGGAAYGSVLVKKEGSWAVRVAVCGSCSDE